MLEPVRRLLERLGADDYPLGATFDLLLEKRKDVENPIETALIDIELEDERKCTQKAARLKSKLINQSQAVIELLFRLRNTAQITQTDHPFRFGTIHPHFDELSRESYRYGVFTGSRMEMEHCTWDVINPQNEPFKTMAAHYDTEARKALHQGDGPGPWVDEILFRGRERLYQQFVSPVKDTQQPPAKKFKYLSTSQKPRAAPPSAPVSDVSSGDDDDNFTGFDFERLRDRLTAPRFGDGWRRTWEERQTDVTPVSQTFTDLVDSKHSTDLCACVMPASEVPFLPLSEVHYCLQFCLVGLENKLFPFQSHFQTENRTCQLVESLATVTSSTGMLLSQIREKSARLAQSESAPVHRAVGLATERLISFLERAVMSVSSSGGSIALWLNVINRRPMAELIYSLEKVTEQLVSNRRNASLDSILDSSLTGLHFLPLTLLIKASLRPVLASLNTWLHEGLWTEVLAGLIQHQSRYQFQRNRYYWTHSYTKSQVISPIFVTTIDTLVLIGKSLNLLRLLDQGHFLLGADFESVKIEVRAGEDLVRYKSKLAEFYHQIEVRQEAHEEEFFETKRAQERELQEARREHNSHLDRAAAEREAVSKARKEQIQKEARETYQQQMEERTKEKERQRKAEQEEEERIKKYHDEKKRLVEAEKERMIKEHEVRMGKKDEEKDDEEAMEVDIPDVKETKSTPVAANRKKIMSHTSLTAQPGSDDVTMTSPVPRRKSTKSHMSESAFVTGSMELKRNVRPPTPKKNVSVKKMSDEEFVDLAKRLTLETIEQNRNIKQPEVFKFLTQPSSPENDTIPATISPLTFCDNIQQSIEIPINQLLRCTSRAVVFELLENQGLRSVLGSLSGLMLFQDGVFADSYCDNLFASLRSSTSNRSLYSLLEESKKGIVNEECRSHSASLRIAHSRGSAGGGGAGPLHRLSEIQLFMEVSWPANIIVDDEAMHGYKKLNRFLVQLKYAQWAIDAIWSRPKFQRLMVIRVEMSNFLRALQQHCIRDVIHNQQYRLQRQIEEQARLGHLSVDSLRELHELFLKKCLTQCLLSTKRSADCLRTIHQALKMILTFSQSYHDLVPGDEVAMQRILKLGADFRRSMVDIVRMTHALAATLELADEKQSLRDLLMTLDYSGFYVSQDPR